MVPVGSMNSQTAARASRPSLWFAAAATALCACAGPSQVPTIEATRFAPALNVDLQHSTKTANGEYFRDLSAGTGAAATAGQTLDVHYTGWLADGTRFDSNSGGAAFSFALGARQVIDGWDQGLVGVRVGGTRQLIIPPALGYGETGAGPIPPNAILVFTVQVDAAK